MTEPLVSVENLTVEFRTDAGVVRAVTDVSFQLHPGESLGLVGESGSGKSVTNLAIMGLIPQPPGRIVGGRALYRGRDLLRLPARELMRLRGNRIAMIFQDPMTSLNPFLTVEEQLTEITKWHLKLSHAKAVTHAIEMLERVGIPAADRRIRDYPHQFSGGMRQRVMIAMALSCKPDVLIADEPTTALDVTIQAQILDLMKDLQRTQETSIILITHDLGVVANICQHVAVMYGGRIVEQSPVDKLFAEPRHPYTLGLLGSVPRWDTPRQSSLQVIQGQPPDLSQLPAGCAFAPRCPFAFERCVVDRPELSAADKLESRFACFVDVRTTNTHHTNHGANA